MKKRLCDPETKEALERELREFISRMGKMPNWDSFVSMLFFLKEMLIEYWLMLDCKSEEKFVCNFLEKYHYYAALGHFLERLSAGQYYSPTIVKVAEAYEKACEWKNALRLYRKGIEICNPTRIEVYDEKHRRVCICNIFP